MKSSKIIIIFILLLILTQVFLGCSQQKENDEIEYEPTENEIDIVMEIGNTYNVLEGMNHNINTFSFSKKDIISFADNIITGIGVGKTSIIFHENNSRRTIDVKVVREGGLNMDITFDRGYFYGKKVVFYGDSISARATLSQGQKDYKEKLAFALVFEYQSFAVSVSLLTYEYSKKIPRTSGVEYITNNMVANSLSDYAIIWYGTNDFKCNVPIGSAPDDFVLLNEVNTLKSGIRYSVDTLRKHNPKIKIIFLTMLYRDDMAIIDEHVVDSNNETLLKYGKAVSDMCYELDCTFVDIFPIFNHDNFYKGSIYTSDGLHPNYLGHNMISEYLLQR